MISFSFISLLSATLSVVSIIIVLNIFKRVYEEDYKKPWLFIGISTIFLVSAQLLQFSYNSFDLRIINGQITEIIIHILEFISITILTYALLLEYLILKYYKGKFVKMKFIPIQEGTLGGELDLNIESGISYLATKKDKNVLLNSTTQAIKKGFEGFLLIEENPRNIRTKFNLSKTPIAWISQIDSSIDSDYLKDSLDENSDIVDPLHLNNIINYIDNFLEQSQNPFIFIDLNLLIRTNNFTIFEEFLRYVSEKTQKYNGILIANLNNNILQGNQIKELNNFLRDLEL